MSFLCFVFEVNWGTKTRNHFYFSRDREHKAKKLDNWSSPATPQERNLEILGTGIHLPHSCRWGRGLLVPGVSREEKLPLLGKTAALQQEAGITTAHKVLGWNTSSTYTCQTWAKLHRGRGRQALHAGEVGLERALQLRKTLDTHLQDPWGFLKNRDNKLFCLVWWLFGGFLLILFSERPFYLKLSIPKHSAPGIQVQNTKV